MGVIVMRSVLLSCVAVFAVSVPASAFAADLPSRQAAVSPPPPPVFNWTGIYLGAQIGYEFGRDASSVPGLVPTVYASPGGVIGGVHIGYNYQNGHAVAGIEADVNGSNYSASVVNPFDGTVKGVHSSVDGSIRGRLGLSYDRVLFYGTGGVAYGSIQDDYTVPAIGFDPIPKGHIGWTAGAGVEYAINDRWSARVEYRLTDYGHYTDYISGTTFSRTNHETDNRVQAGFSYKFNTFAAPAAVVAKY